MKKGFTLIELLVVIAIIAILAAILFPVFAQAREKTRQTKCLSNCKQIGTAIQLYTDDYDETLPGSNDVDKAGTWPVGENMFTDGFSSITQMLYPYCKNYAIFTCPSCGPEKWYYDVTNKTYTMYNKLWNGTVMHSGSSGEREYGPVALAQMSRTSEIALFIERDYNDVWQRFVNIPVSWGWWDAGRNANFKPKHNDGENITYADGHAKYCKLSQITWSMLGLKKKDGTDPQWYSETPGGSSVYSADYDLAL
ncbi:MAG: prepilin-type N-terminal cleavage/methylation domain-containing protein [Armatimonadetes bacterium]|nr:prepilin-type N-terminal cleavage/methylation domain-containing protein [Candidatus Hippobium faecium]